MDDDELCQARDNFYAGFFERSCRLALSVSPSNDAVASDKEALIALSKYASGTISSSEEESYLASLNPSVRAVGLAVSSTKSDTKDDDFQQLRAVVSGTSDPTAILVLSCLLLHQGKYAECVEVTEKASTLEVKACRVQALIMMNRVDLAEQVSRQMASENDDAAVTKLAGAWVNIATGNYQEAYLTYGDLQEIYASDKSDSLTTLTGKVVANMQRRQWPEALEELLRAAVKDPLHVLPSLISCHHHMRNYVEADKCYAKLSELCPEHTMVQGMKKLDRVFSTA